MRHLFTISLAALVLALIYYGPLFAPPALAADDDDSGDGVDCFPIPGPCDDVETLSPSTLDWEWPSAQDLPVECPAGITEVTGDIRDFCWAADELETCTGTCYQFSESGSLVWLLAG